MKPRFNHKTPLFLVLVLTVTLLLGLETAETAEQAATNPADNTTATPAATTPERIPSCAGTAPTVPAAAGSVESKAAGTPCDEAADFRAMKQRYGQDATGVRARLGMCRGGKGGQGGGPHRRFRGGNRWNPPQ